MKATEKNFKEEASRLQEEEQEDHDDFWSKTKKADDDDLIQARARVQAFTVRNIYHEFS